MKLFLIAVMLFGLSACSAPNREEAGPPPDNYKLTIERILKSTDVMLTWYKNVQITEPQPGRVEFVPGWRVCVRDETSLDKSFFFVPNKPPAVLDHDALCLNYTYAPWPEMEGAVASMVTDTLKKMDAIIHPVWTYGTVNDALRRTSQAEAILMSQNKVELKFPYTGGTRGTLHALHTSQGYGILLGVDNGQLACKKEGCEVSLRFDNDPIQTVHVTFVEPNQKSLAAVQNGDSLVTRLQTSKSLIIELQLTGNGARQFTFNTAGFDLSKLNAPAFAGQGAD